MRKRTFAIAVHGGAGAVGRARLASAAPGLLAALDAGYRLLRRGAPALDAVCAAVRALEDDPRFNAGTGSVPNLDGEVECDASVMHGPSLRAGAVACLRGIRHPVDAARRVMERTDHLLLAGEGARRFALAAGLPEADLLTEERKRLHARERRRFTAGKLSRFAINAALARARGYFPGTVGAVALDAAGELAAATSTGGILLKLEGRVGDSAVIGAGTWADAHAAVSATGTGEAILRAALAKSAADLAALGIPPAAAAEAAVAKLDPLGMTAGLILLDRSGEPACAFNTRGMSAAHRRAGDESPVLFPGLRRARRVR